MSLGLLNRVPSAAMEGARMLALTAFSFVLGYVLTVAGTEALRLDARVAFSVAVLICTIINFFGCRYFVFRNARARFFTAAARFFVAAIGFRVAEIAAFSLMTILGTEYRIAYVLTAGIAFLAKYVVAKFVVFAPPRV